MTTTSFPLAGWTTYACLRLLGIAVRLLSDQSIDRLAAIGGSFAYLVAVGSRRSATRNLSTVIGRSDPDLLALRVREAFRTQTANYCDLVGIPLRSPAELASRIQMEGLRHLDKARATGRGTLLVCAHLGNFDAAGQIAVHLGLPVLVLVEPIRPKKLLDYVTRLRANFGLRFVPIDDTSMGGAIQELRGGGIIAVAIDRDTRGSGDLVRFFGGNAQLSSAVVTLARRTRSCIVPFAAYRLGGGRFRLVIRSAIDSETVPARVPDEELSSTIRERMPARILMEKVVTEIECLIRREPGQWVMFSPLFPSVEVS